MAIADRGGGSASLAGYLFQILGIAGLQTFPACSEPTEVGEFQALAAIVSSGDLRNEVFGQDAFISPSDFGKDGDCVLVQFKYSQGPSPQPIGTDDLKEMLNRFRDSERRAIDHGWRVSSFVVITNRALRSVTEKLIDATVKPGGEAGSPLNGKQVEILRRMRRECGADLEVWTRRLQCFGHTYGASDDDIRDGLHQLVGKLATDAAHRMDYRFQRSELVRAFTGSAQAEALQAMSAQKLSADQRQRFADRQNLGFRPFRRTVLDEISNAVSRSAFVVISGPGGCGKSVALHQWCDDYSDTGRSAPALLIYPEVAALCMPNWITKLVCDWANLPPEHGWRTLAADLSVARAARANPCGPQPIMVLALDGLDENQFERSVVENVGNVLRWFWEEDRDVRAKTLKPRATLIVTCRDEKDVPGKWLIPDVSGRGYRGQLPEHITVGRFSGAELHAAAESNFPELAAALEVGTGPPGNPLGAELLDPAVPAPLDRPPGPVSDAGILEACHHPAIFGALLELDDGDRLAALDGDPGAINRLADAFVLRFLNKLLMRRFPLDAEQSKCVLSAIARHTRGRAHASHGLTSEWCAPACHTDAVSDILARSLHREAISYDLIRLDGDQRWRWEHPFVEDYLAGLDPGGEDPK